MSDNKRMITHYVGDRCPGGHRNDPMEQREAQVTEVKYDKERIDFLKESQLRQQIVYSFDVLYLLDLVESQYTENERLKERVKLLESALGAIHEQRYFRGG